MTAWPVDDDDRDPVLDACLAEFLGGVTPPDLSSRIMATWQSRQGQRSVGASSNLSSTVVQGDTSASDATKKEGFDGEAEDGQDGRSPTLRAVSTKSSSMEKAIRTSATFPGELGRSASRDSRPSARSKLNGNRRDKSLSLATLAATLVVGVGLGLVGLYWFGPASLNNQQIVENRASTDDLDHRSSEAPDGSGTSPFAQDTPRDSDGTTVPGDAELPSDLAGPLAGPGADPRRPAPPIVEPMDRLTLVSTVNGSLQDLWQRSGIGPAPAVADAEWIQRVFQYLLGREPEPGELQAFLDDSSPEKRAQWVERLHTESPYLDEYVQFWKEFWTTSWLGPADRMTESTVASREGFQRYLAEAIHLDRSLKQVVYELLASEGAGEPTAADYHGATNFLLAHYQGDSVPTTAAVSRLLLGRRLDCAQCHDHPFHAEWTQQDFWELNSFFRQVSVDRPTPEEPARLSDRDADDDQVFFEEPNGYQRAAEPVLPNGVAIPSSRRIADVNRREFLARWVADSEEFPQAFVNRVWAHFFGYGIVHPMDDMGPHNPPTDPELLKTLAKQFVAHGYRLRSLTQWIVLSDAFQRSAMRDDRNFADVPELGESPLFSRFYLRPSSPSSTWESLQQVAQWRGAPDGVGDQARMYMARRLARLLAQNLGGEGGIAENAPSAAEMRILPEGKLMLLPGLNRTEGLVYQQIIKRDNQRITTSDKRELSDDEKISHLFLAVVARPPETRELELARKMLTESGGAETVLQDIWWSLLNSKEFLPNLP